MKSRTSGLTALAVFAALALWGCDSGSKLTAAPPKEGNTFFKAEPGASSTGPSAGTTDSGTPAPTEPGAAEPPVEAPDTGPAPSDSPDEPGTPAEPAATPSAGSGGPVTLRLALTKGDTARFQTETETFMDFGAPGGKKQPEPMRMSSETVVKVLDVTGGKARVEMTVGKMDMKGGAGVPGAKEAMDKAAKEAVGVKVSAFYDQFGQPSGLKYDKGNRAQAMAAGIDNDTGFFGMTYPEKALRAGDTWSKTFDFKSMAGGSMMPGATWKDSNVTTTFTLKSVDAAAGTATIGIVASGKPSMSMKMTMPGGKEGKAPAPQEMKMEFAVSGTGTAVVDIKSGQPRSITYSMETDMKSSMMGAGGMKQRTKATIKRV